eukprot:5147856-Prymnesium_polylepis.1
MSMETPKNMKNRKKPAQSEGQVGLSQPTTSGPIGRNITFCRSAESVAAAGIGGQIASLDGEHARVHENEGQMRQRCQRSVVHPARVETGATHNDRSRILQRSLSQRPEAKVEPEEADADKQGHNHARLLGVSADRQHPARQRQLAAHLERLPPE